ncbi:glycine cleavage system aminomethyltransferase GcvT [Microlunatus kandeliicorticis]|nr:glycine cleavage system aminomethyltransferase GcvT [Microlunatus kandeliicorticis]
MSDEQSTGPAGTATLQRSPLHDRHVALGAKFAAFGGWSMPLEYAGAGVLAEHTAVRTAVGIFDVSHLGKIDVRGPGAAEAVNAVLTADLGRIAPGQAQYTLLCTPDGGVVDDMIAYLRSPDDVFLVPNAANGATVAAVLAEAVGDGVRVTDRHHDFAVLAVQGTLSDEVLRTAGLPVGHPYLSFVETELAGVPVIVCRTGYTGERGYELVAPSDRSHEVWDALVAAGEPYGLQPAGLAARDTLRTEMGYPLCGQDIGPDITPVQARLGWAVGWAKPAFRGHEALRREKEQGPQRTLRALRAVRRGIPRPGMTVRRVAEATATEDTSAPDVPAELGRVTSGTFSPTLKTGIALALVDPGVRIGEVVAVDVRSRAEQFEVVKPPFVAAGVREP